MEAEKRVAKVEREWQKAQVYNVRIKTMIDGEGIPFSVEFDDDEIKQCEYYLLYVNEEAVATCRVNYLTNSIAKIERVIVMTDYQNQGLGTVLIEGVTDLLKQNQVRKIVIDSREKALHFYERIGYRIVTGAEQIRHYQALIDQTHLVKKEHKSLFPCVLLEMDLVD